MKFKQLYLYAQLMRLNKPIGILLLLWPTLFALWLAAEGKPDFFIVAIFVMGVVVMRSAGCVINDIVDRSFDKHVRRTAHRPVAIGIIKPKQALICFVVLSFIAFLLVFQLNFLTIQLSFGALLLALIYPYMKRYTHLPQVFLGAAFAFAIPMAFAAVTNQITPLAWVLFFAMLCWIVAYDTQYALVDKEDDLKIGVKSTAILFGNWDKLIIACLQCLTVIILSILGYYYGFGVRYFLGIGVATVLIFYQQYLIKERQPEKCFRAFLNNNLFGAALFLGLLLEYNSY